MRPLLTAADVQALDRASEERGVPVEVLMERAGRAVAGEAARLAGGTYGRRVVVLCGKGNNGGDGLVAARHLAGWGMGVSVFLVQGSAPLSDPAAASLARLREVRVREMEPAARDLERELARADLAVDAIFGMGLRGSVEGPAAAAIEAGNLSGKPVVSVDVPSGVEGDTGQVRGPAVSATVTVTFGDPKVGTTLFPGASHAGEVVVADIGLPPDLVTGDLQLLEDSDVASLLPRRSPEDHKRRSGVVLVVGGSRAMTGAPVLVARGAYGAGAGLVRVAAPVSALPAIQASLTESTFQGLSETRDGTVSGGAEVAAEGFDAVAIGPGLGVGEDVAGFVSQIVSESSIPLVLDADGLNAFAGRPRELAERPAAAVFTPHASEIARLFDMPVSEVLEDRIGVARKAAAELRGVVLLKGARTVIASPDGDVRVNPTGSPSLATGGTGDVLTGMIAAYLARGLLPLDAAAAGAFVHGRAGELLEEGATAEDVARALPAAAGELTG